jgi:hypothetical protein
MFDAYTLRARLAPALIAAVPPAALIGAGALSDDEGLRAVALVTGAIGVALSAVVRTAGRRLESGLWDSWGGSPTLRRLRWRDTEDVPSLERLHRRITAVVGRDLPNASEEHENPNAADRRYEEAIAALRERTRDVKRFKLLFNENAEYGFRRNSLGIRRAALGLAATTLLLSLVLAVFGDWQRWLITAGIAAACGLYWWRVVTPDWVKDAAEAYADRLFGALETLENH